MISPDVQTNEMQAKNYLSAELNTAYDNMIQAKVEIIKGGITICNSMDKEKVFSIGLGFALAVLNQQ